MNLKPKGDPRGDPTFWDAVELLMDAWNQFAYRAKIPDKRFKTGYREMLWDGGLSTLEDIYAFLKEHEMLDRYFMPRWDRLPEKGGSFNRR